MEIMVFLNCTRHGGSPELLYLAKSKEMCFVLLCSLEMKVMLVM